MKGLLHSLMIFGALTLSHQLLAQSEGYKTPPASIKQVLDSQPAPTVVLGSGSDQNYMAILQQDRLYMGLEEVAKDEYRLGGIRANVRNMSQSR
ncbi:MAG: hypothetical protein R3Y50_10980, partial [Rikenellaceae bacterium]